MAQCRDVVQHEHGAAAARARHRHHVRDEELAGVPIELDFNGRRRLATQRRRQLRGDVGVANHLEVMTILGRLREPEHRPHRRVGQHESAGGVHEDDAFDHAGENRVHVRALARHLLELRAQLPRRIVEHVGHRADLVAAMIARRPAEVSCLVSFRRLDDRAEPAAR